MGAHMTYWHRWLRGLSSIQKKIGTPHCTMQLSTQLETSKVFKSKGLFFAQFWSTFENFNSEWKKTAKILWEKLFPGIFVKNVISIAKKPVQGVREPWNFAHNLINLCPEKNLKITFSPGALNMVKMGSEIYKYFTLFFHCVKYLILFWG